MQTMKPTVVILCGLILGRLAVAAPGYQVEAGATLFTFESGQFEPGPTPLVTDDPPEVAPYVAMTYGFTDQFGLRLAYHYLNDVRATVEFGSPPGFPPSPLPVVVWGHYRDDVHVVSLAPEFSWSLSRAFTVTLGPQLNWVASRGTISYSTNALALTLLAPRPQRDEGFTAGGTARLNWSIGARTAITVGYHYLDLDPSFDRKAHAFSGGLQWKF